MDEQHDIDRAEEARYIIDHPMFVEAFYEIEQNYTDAWRNSRHNATEERERLWLAINLLGTVKVHLESIIAGGTLARADLETLTMREDFKLN